MRNLLNPRWIFIINTLPIVLLFFLFSEEYTIIKSLLDQESIKCWKVFGSSLMILGILNLAYAIYLTLKKQNVSFLYGVIALLSYIPYIYLYNSYYDQIIPFSIPSWMVSNNIILYVGTFLMPTLAYSIFILVIHFTPKDKNHTAWKNFLIAIITPVFWYVFFLVILPLWKPLNSNFETHALIIFIISGTIIFLFFLVRGVFILATKKATVFQKYELVWKIPIALVFPLLGLLINNEVLFNDSDTANTLGIFGDFNTIWFYILAVLNGILICLPNKAQKTYQILLYIGRCITFMYTFYFFIVFLPFLPLSVIAIIAMGSGFLMLTPLVLFIIHINELTKNFALLTDYFSKNTLRIISVLSFLIIPLCITVSFITDRNILHETLDYIYSPDYSKTYKVNKKSLVKTLEVVKKNREKRNGDMIFGNQIPYLSSYFNKIVLGNLTLSSSKIDKIAHIFNGINAEQVTPENLRNEEVNVSKIQSKSTYDPIKNVWKSWVDIEITNNSNTNFAEYATTFKLPEGCWISDYYLYVGDKKEMGILAEKKAAMWVFSQIQNENKDPGILYYLTGNKVAFRIFPFFRNEIRKTGIEFLHKTPIQLTIDQNVLTLGDTNHKNIENPSKEKQVIYISAQQKQKLKKVQRTPYFHFLVDISKEKHQSIDEFTKRIEKLVHKEKTLGANAQITFVNSYISQASSNKKWKEDYQNQEFQGGFYLDRAIKTTLFNSYQNNTHSYPILVVVTDTIQNAILDNDFSDFSMTFPENNQFYNLSKKGGLQPYSLIKNPSFPLDEKTEVRFDQKVLEYKYDTHSIAYLPDNGEPSIILKDGIYKNIKNTPSQSQWDKGLMMQGLWISQILHPETSDKEWIELVKNSFSNHIMTPVTSFLVVENEAQKAILKKKQEQVLSGKKSLDIGDETTRMSEPNIIITLILLLIILCYKKRITLKHLLG
ncbi:putative secreted protein with MSEP-CTERM motif [Aquimarina sp. MAR_2010_214]|uniref:MSEP-CTERM sorting domain-containing protein n=1 Tax=Aquimarina sp. MAR_2010_214 TaxID=1250026 RepID=UPI000C701269|nr:MSEP-CTERM sorting domain-containing protein [Aquimarina sp. MAR_2010_214]PKV49846.1 putative secreted protein with MSEP-CTERM motif [Aquimarina sp. MAR_2010_214]